MKYGPLTIQCYVSVLNFCISKKVCAFDSQMLNDIKFIFYFTKIVVVYGVFQNLPNFLLIKVVHVSKSDLRSDETVFGLSQWHKFFFEQ